MNKTLNRHIQDTIQHLELNQEEANYLKSCMEMLIIMAEREQLEKDHKATMEIIGGIGKK